jgi:hypothetical protein
MNKQSLSNSFIVRVYRVDTDNPGNITGIVEALDGSGTQEPFTGADELAAILSRSRRSGRKTKRRSPRQLLSQDGREV